MKRSLLVYAWLVLLTSFSMVGCDDTSLEPPFVTTGVIKGQVFLHDDFGQQLTDHSGIHVMISDPEITATTNSEGWFELTGVPAGVYAIKYSKQGYEPYEISQFQFVGSDTIKVVNQRLLSIPEARTITLTEPDIQQRGDSIAYYVYVDSVVAETLLIYRDGQYIQLYPGDSIKAGLVYILGNHWKAYFTVSVNQTDKPARVVVIVSQQTGATLEDPSSFQLSMGTHNIETTKDLILDKGYLAEYGFVRGQRVHVTAWQVNSQGKPNGVRSNEVSFDF